MNIGPMILQGVLEILQNALKSQAATLNDAQISNLAQRWHRYEIALGTLTAQANIPMESTIKNIAVAYEDAISAIGLTEHQKKQVSLAKTLFMLIKKVHINLQEEIHKLYFKQKKLEKVLLLLTQESKLRALELDLHLAILLHQESLRQQKLLELQNLEPHRLLLLELKTELDSILTTYQTSLSQLHSQRDILRERQSSIDMQLQSVSEQKTHLQNAIVIATEDLQKIVSAMEKTPKILEELVQFTQTSNAQIQTLESDLILWNKAEAEIEGLKQQAKVATAFEEAYRPLEQVTKNLDAFLTREFFHIADILEFKKQNIPVEVLLKHVAQNQSLLDALQHLQLTPQNPKNPESLLQNLQQLAQWAKVTQTLNHIFSPEEKGHAYNERFKIQSSFFAFSNEDYETVRQLLQGGRVIDVKGLEQEKNRLIAEFRKLQLEAEAHNPLEVEQKKETILAELKKIDQQQKLAQLNIPELHKQGIDIIRLMKNIEQGLDPNQIMQQSTHMLSAEDIGWYKDKVVTDLAKKKDNVLQEYNISDRHALENVVNHKAEQVRIELDKIAAELQKDGKKVEITFSNSKEIIQSLKNALDSKRQESGLAQQKMQELIDKITQLKDMVPIKQHEIEQKRMELSVLENQYSKLVTEQNVCQKLDVNLQNQEKLVTQKYELELAIHQLKTQDMLQMQQYEQLVKKGELSKLPQIDKVRALLKNQILEKKTEVKHVTQELEERKEEAISLTDRLQPNTPAIKEKVPKRVVLSQYQEEKTPTFIKKLSPSSRDATPESPSVKNKI